jgi:signal peptidase II
MSPARRNDLLMVATGALVILLDQLTKNWIVQYFGSGAVTTAPIPIVGDVLQLIYVPNTGVAFSLFEGQTIKFIFIGIALLVICVLYWRTRDDGSLPLKLTFGLILGGAIGNLLDRFTRHYVVDFIHFQIPGHFDWPVFNVADSAISVGVVLLAYLLWRSELTPHTPVSPVPEAPSSTAASTKAASAPRVRRKVASGR